MHEIVEGLIWTGNIGDLRDARALHIAGVEAVVELAADEPSAELGRGFVRLRFPLVDNEGNEPSRIRSCVVSVASLFRERVPTLVTCSAGLSRTPVVVAAARAVAEGIDPDDSLREVAACMPTDVAPALWRDVRDVLGQTAWDLPGPGDHRQSAES